MVSVYGNRASDAALDLARKWMATQTRGFTIDALTAFLNEHHAIDPWLCYQLAHRLLMDERKAGHIRHKIRPKRWIPIPEPVMRWPGKTRVKP